MQPTCRDFRGAWLRAERLEGDHAASCPDCRLWVERAERLVSALAVVRYPAPEELALRVNAELAGDHGARLARVLGSVIRREAPAALEIRVAEDLRNRAQQPGEKAQALRALDVPSAPDVLERLVSEELQAPERHAAERFTGNLPRLGAPEALRELVHVQVRRRALSKLVLAPALALTAAAAAVWIAIRSDVPRQHRYRFEVVHSASLEGIDPRALALAESLGGPPGGPR